MASSSLVNSSSEPKKLLIEGVPVVFPKLPYPCQVEYMTCTIRALNTNANALLESPTGTGKTLSLLCSTLAWQKKRILDMKAKKASSLSHTQPKGEGSASIELNNIPVIVYASRTHTQLAQVVKELKTTTYRPKIIVLGSRDQLCVHERLSNLRGSALNTACQNLVSKHSCGYRTSLDMRIANNDHANLPLTTDILDIEDMAKLGKSGRFCSYFYSRSVSKDAELVLLPYNYLLDATMRSKIEINWQNAIIIFDEAHNVERVASDAASISLTSAEIASCIEELQNVLKILRERSSYSSKESEASSSSNKQENLSLESLGLNTSPPTLERVMVILKSLFAMEGHIDAVHLSKCGIGNTPACVMPGNWLKSMMESSGFVETQALSTIIEIQRCINLLTQEVQDAVAVGYEPSVNLSNAEPKLTLLIKCFERVFRPSDHFNQYGAISRTKPSNLSDYKVYICEKDREVSTGNGNFKQFVKMRVVNYWAFSPGIALEDLKNLGVKSIIMTSGTLSPMDSFTDDMKLPFQIQLQNDHVISDKQVWVGAISKGINGKQLNSSYNNRETNEYKDELGNSILTICHTMIGNNCIGGLPIASELSGGILVFFPSYGTMDSAVNRWKETGLYNRLLVAGGGVVIEPKMASSQPRNKQDTNQRGLGDKDIKKFSFLETKKQSLDAVDPEDADLMKGIVGEFEKALNRSKRCILLAVCRGKVSEGIDFSDNRGRVVIITGLPYSPHMDPWVMLKRQYLDEKSKIIAPTTSNDAKLLSKLTGQEWYQQSAVRAVNQAIGRVIRHKNDWGAIVLLDDRFIVDRQKNQLSKWVRPRHKSYSSFVESMVDLRKFFSVAQSDPILTISAGVREPIRISRPILKLTDSLEEDSKIYSRETILSDADIPTQTQGTSYINPNLLNRKGNRQLNSMDESYADLLDGEEGLDLGKHFQKVLSSQVSRPQQTTSTRTATEEKPPLFSIFDRKTRPLANTSSTKNLDLKSTVDNLSRKITLSFDNDELRKPNKASNSSGASSKFALNSQSELLSSQLESYKPTVLSNQVSVFNSQREEARSSSLLEALSKPANLKSSEKPHVDIDEDEMEWLSVVLKHENSLKAKKILLSMNAISSWTSSTVEKFTEEISELFKESKRLFDLSRVIEIFKKPVYSQYQSRFADSLRRTLSEIQDSIREAIKSATAKKVSVKIEGNENSKNSKVDESIGTENDLIVPSIRYASVAKSSTDDMSSIQLSQSSTKGSSQTYAPSKRALAMFVASKEKSSSQTNIKKARIQEILGKPSAPTRNLFESMASSNLMLSGGSDQRQTVSSSKLSCLICQDTAQNPCAGECGHICCEACWKQWLITTRKCPLCKRDMTADNMSKIILK